MDYFVQAKIGAVLHGRLKKTFRSVRWTHGIIVVASCGFNVFSGNGGKDVVSFLDDNGLQRIIFMGHSLGGKTAMQFAVQFPERVSSLIMVDIAPVQYKHRQKILELIEAMQELQLPTKMSRSEIEKKLAQKIHDTHILSFLMTNLIFQKGEFKWLIGLEQITFRMPDLLNTIELESLYSGLTLFIGGANSDYIARVLFEDQEVFPESNETMLKNCVHWLHVEQPEDFQKTVAAILRQNELL